MIKKYIFAGLSVLFLGASIIVSGYLIGDALKSVNELRFLYRADVSLLYG